MVRSSILGSLWGVFYSWLHFGSSLFIVRSIRLIALITNTEAQHAQAQGKSTSWTYDTGEATKQLLIGVRYKWNDNLHFFFFFLYFYIKNHK